MKSKQLVLTVLATVALTVSLSSAFAETTIQYTREVVVETKTEYVNTGLSPAQMIWLSKLMVCESGVKEHALNPADSNGLPSRGILQFQDATFRGFTKLYGISTTLESPKAEIAEAQVQIVTHWLLNPGSVKWENQFPNCVKQLGVPPTK